MIKKIILKLIKLYQIILSPDHSWRKFYHGAGFCRFRPTCSEYAYQAIEKYGVFKGVLKAVWRIMRCNPWSQGGYDPL